MFLAVLLVTAIGDDRAALHRGRAQRRRSISRSPHAESLRPADDQAQIDRIETMSRRTASYIAPVIQLVFLAARLPADLRASRSRCSTRMLGGDATFKQVFAVVAHSGVILARCCRCSRRRSPTRASRCRARRTWPCSCRFSTSSSFLARLLGSIDLIFIWWMLSLAIGLGVLYRKRTGPIAITCSSSTW